MNGTKEDGREQGVEEDGREDGEVADIGWRKKLIMAGVKENFVNARKNEQ